VPKETVQTEEESGKTLPILEGTKFTGGNGIHNEGTKKTETNEEPTRHRAALRAVRGREHRKSKPHRLRRRLGFVMLVPTPTPAEGRRPMAPPFVFVHFVPSL
jgi:hypothetical protein